ncbi:MAG: ArsC/Spx/MgsR family protein [Paracoccaceae bacterium]
MNLPALAAMREGTRLAPRPVEDRSRSAARPMARVPKLIERPVVLANGKAALGRPPEAVLAIL